MIDLYTAGTGNGHRAALILEESGLPYRAHKLNLQAGDQKKPEFLAINPAGAIPAIVDSDGPGGATVTLGQSGAIVLYIAEKSGRFLPKDPVRRAAALHWMMHACTDCAVSSGVIFQYSNYGPDKTPANIAYFENRLLGFLGPVEKRLEGRDYLADELSVADISLYSVYAGRKALLDRAGGFPNLHRWGAMMAARPAIAKGMTVSA